MPATTVRRGGAPKREPLAQLRRIGLVVLAFCHRLERHRITEAHNRSVVATCAQ